MLGLMRHCNCHAHHSGEHEPSAECEYDSKQFFSSSNALERLHFHVISLVVSLQRIMVLSHISLHSFILTIDIRIPWRKPPSDKARASRLQIQSSFCLSKHVYSDMAFSFPSFIWCSTVSYDFNVFWMISLSFFGLRRLLASVPLTPVCSSGRAWLLGSTPPDSRIIVLGIFGILVKTA